MPAEQSSVWSDSDAALVRGQRIGKYVLVSQLSVGGMSEVFLAFTTGPGGFRKVVVIKRVLPQAQGDEQAVKMFLDEARITGAFNHPNIAQVFELGEDRDGLYLAMEFIAGQDLNHLAHACAVQHEPVPLGFAISVIRDLSQALHYAHTFRDASGQPSPVIHRDVAQKNVMVTYDGGVKLLDFGIAKAKDSLGRTAAGTVKGTTGYMSPEQVRGDPLDGRSDVFAAGVVLHELLTGKRLFSAETEVEEMRLVLDARIPSPRSLQPSIPLALSDVVMTALARDPELRYPTARDFAKALDAESEVVPWEEEQRAALMRRLFATKREQTEVLLEQARRAPGPGSAPAPRPVEKGAPVVIPPATAPRPRADTLPSSRRSHRGPGFLGTLVAVGLVTAGVAFAALMFGRTWKEAPGPVAVGVPLSPPRPLPPLPEPTLEAKAEPPPSSKPVRPVTLAGTLTLITEPTSTVSRGKQLLGKTPLFNVPLPAGTHLLTVTGPDGQERALSAPISSGRNTAYRVKLHDLPAR